MTAELAVDSRCLLGEGLLWNHLASLLHWVDIERGTLFTWDLEGEPDRLQVGDKVGGLTLREDGALLAFCEEGLVREVKEGRVKEVAQLKALKGGRFNDVAATPTGEVLCGALPVGESPGCLWSLSLSGEFELLMEGVGCSNGIGFAPDRSAFYFTDTSQNVIYRSLATGAFNPEIFVDMKESQGSPDGLCVDAEGGIWSAMWGGSSVVRRLPDGSEDVKIELPVPQVTSCAFGGPELDRFFITTASFEGGEGAGGLFTASTPHRGLLEPLARVRFPS